MAERKEWWEILRDQFASRGLLDPESERIQEAVSAAPAAQRQARGLLSLDPQAESDTVLEMGLGSLPGTGQLMALRDLERARRAKDPGAAAMAASNFIPFGTLLNRFRRGPMSELDVYHGTPHRFPGTEANPLGEFDASKIGTGEGAQAYGHGVYLAENPGVADMYRKTLTQTDDFVDGELLDSSIPKHFLARVLSDESGNVLAAKESLQILARPGASKSVANSAKQALQLLESGQRPVLQSVKPDGSLYKADLPDQMIDRMLDYDKPLTQQPKNVQAALTRLGDPQEKLDAYDDALLKALFEDAANPGSVPRNPSGADILKKLENQYGRQGASDYLRALGIPGIRYLDAGSRDGGSGTRNFVVFPGEEKKVKILERK